MPFVNKFNGEVKVMTKSQGKHLSEDWARAKVVKNDEGVSVFRFHLAAPVKGDDGKIHAGVATVDISEVEGTDTDGNQDSK